MSGTVVALRDLERSELEGYFSQSTFKRGASYARNKRVLSLTWDEREQVLRASVVGHGALYQTVARFNDRGDALGFIEGECTCPIGYNCKHVAAIVLAAGEPRGAVRPRGASPRPAPARHVSSAAQTSAWEQPLRALVEARSRPHVGNPLAIELRLTASRYPDHGAPRLMARLMRSGARGGWVNGSLDWGSLESWQVRDGGYRADHLALIRELHAVYQLHDAQTSYLWGTAASAPSICRAARVRSCGRFSRRRRAWTFWSFTPTRNVARSRHRSAANSSLTSREPRSETLTWESSSGSAASPSSTSFPCASSAARPMASCAQSAPMWRPAVTSTAGGCVWSGCPGRLCRNWSACCSQSPHSGPSACSMTQAGRSRDHRRSSRAWTACG